MRVLTPHLPSFVFALTVAIALPLAGQLVDKPVAQTRRHDDPQWLIVRDHLPDPATASPKALEEQADLLRVRRFPEDALDYYGYAVKRGGSTSRLINKIGLTELELHNVVLAEGYFRQAIKFDRNSAQGWNNLAATEYLQRQYSSAVNDYKKAVKLESSTAVFHANLSTAYFETKDYKRARKQADEALKLDPLVYQHSSGAGVAAHPLAVEDRARFSYEMAKLYALHGREEEMLHALAVASESGFDIETNMVKDPVLAKYRNDPRVDLLIVTARALHQKTPAVMTVASMANSKLDALPASR